MEKAEALWRSRIQAEKEEKEEAARRRRQAEVDGARWELVRLEQQRSPDIDPEVRAVLLVRLEDDAAAASEPTKICSAGCGLAENASMFSKKQWSARAVRRCLACMKADVEPKLCAHGKGAFDCAACIAIVKREAEAEAAAKAVVTVKEREPACVLEAEVHVEPEQHDANKKYTEAVVVATKTCAEDVKGQTCYICTQAVHWRTKEVLVRMCACRGTAGVAHVSCLAEQAKILVAEAVENNLDWKVKNERCHRWNTCSLCEQKYHGVVRCALGWACWKTYVDRPEADPSRCMAMTHLGNGLREVKLYEDALSVQEAELSMLRRTGASECSLLATQSNLAITYEAVGNIEKALSMERDVYSGWLKLYGGEHKITLIAANNYAPGGAGAEVGGNVALVAPLELRDQRVWINKLLHVRRPLHLVQALHDLCGNQPVRRARHRTRRKILISTQTNDALDPARDAGSMCK